MIDAAATIGCSYLLLQQKTDDPKMGYKFISMDSANFKKGQLSLCPFEAEVAGLRYACRKENHYLQACPEILIVTDCREMISTYQKPLENIKNRRVQKMFLDICHLNLRFEHIQGIKNGSVDFRSRRPRDSYEAVSEEDIPVRLRLGIRTVRAEKLNIEPIDPRVEKMAELGLADSKYQRMLYHTENRTEDKFLEEDSELRKAGIIRKHLSIFQCSNGAKLLVRNSEEVVVPEQARQSILTGFIQHIWPEMA